MTTPFLNHPVFLIMNAIVANAVAKAYTCHRGKIHNNIHTSMAFDACINHILKQAHRLTDNNSNPKGWIYRVSYNKCMDIQKSKNYTVYIDDNQLKEVKDEDLSIKVEQELKLDVLHDSIENLNEMSKKVIKLRFLKECNYETIAEQTGLSISSIGQTIHRGMRSIKKQVITNQQLAA